MSEELTKPTGERVDWVASDDDCPMKRGLYPRGVFVGTSGTVKIKDAAGNLSTWKVTAPFTILGTVRAVMDTGTVDADDFVLIY